MSQNIGTLVTSPLRPNDSLDPIAIIFSSEAKGGHHSYATYADMLNAQVSYPTRFEFGMLATIYADPTASYNNTYQLQYNYNSTSSSDANNWIQYNGIPQTKPMEWQDSVLSRTSSIPSSNKDGDRYLIIGTISGSSSAVRSNNWNGHVDKIATYDARVNFWNFTFPMEGMSVRADNEKDVIYKYSGIYASGGSWAKEYLNQVYSLTASSSDGINFTAIANLYSYYKPSVFYTRFLTASKGPNLYFNINNVGSASVVKIVGSGIQAAIAAGDFNTDLEYQLIWDGTQFQVPYNSSVTTIGNPETGTTYSGGVYNWNTTPSFVTTTPIGTAIDRFNKILAALVPSASPALSNMAPFYGYNGRLSFPFSDPSVSNFNSATPSVTSGYGAVGLNGLFATSSNRLGVFAATTSSNRNLTMSGIINLNSGGSNTGIPYYNNSFADGNQGYLYLVVNGLTVSTATLSNIAAIDTTNGRTRPGFILGAATASKFATGAAFELFWGRTGSYFIPSGSYLGPYTYTASIGLTANSYGFTRGYNYVKIVQNTTTNIINVSGIDFILDDNPTTVTVTGPSLNVNTYYLDTNYLSGIIYYNKLQITFYANIISPYANVYADGNAITISDYSSTNASPYPNIPDQLLPLPSLTQSSNFNSLSVQTTTITIGPGEQSLRRIDDSIGLYVKQVNKPAANNGCFTFSTAAGYSINRIVFDNFITVPSIGSTEYFREESYRIKSGLAYDTIASITNNPYSSTASLATTNTSDLQIYNGGLRYPTINFQTIGVSSDTNRNIIYPETNYSVCTGTRYYNRYFYYSTLLAAYYQFNIKFSGSASIISTTNSFTNGTNQIKVEVKLPGVTGWLDTATKLNTLTYPSPIDGAGCLDPSSSTIIGGSGYNIQTGWPGVNLNTSSGYIVMRITAPQGWTGYLTQSVVTPY